MSIMRARSSSPIATGLHTPNGEEYNLWSRINVRRSLESVGFLQRREDCKATAASNTCEKPVGSSAMTLPIVLGIVIPVVAAVIILLFLHRRNMKKVKLEDINDPTKGLDFGLEDGGVKRKGKRKSLMFGAEKNVHRQAQLSMDMNLSSPYLLPPGLHGSRESIHSLARTLPTEHDRYGGVGNFIGSDTGSIRSFNPAAENGRAGKPGHLQMPSRQESVPRSLASPLRSPSFPDEKEDPFASPTVPMATRQSPPTVKEIRDSQLPVQPVIPEIGTAYADDKFNADEFEMPDIITPPPAALRPGQDRSRSPPSVPASNRSSEYDEPPLALAKADEVTHSLDVAGLGLDFDIPRILSPGLPHEVESGPLFDAHGNQPQPIIEESFKEEEVRGRPLSRAPAEASHPQSLGVPQQPNKRLSVGFRPLPPAEVTESEDPEFRANRIRSFYKEYFDDSKDPAPPMPTPPQQFQKQQQQQQQSVDYYEDYDNGYLGEAAYYDADSNAFVMPYSQPVTRRAMTPPPAGRSRGPPVAGPRGGPRGPHGPNGSLGGMSLPGGPGRPRAGSAFGPRPGSSASARLGRGQPRKNLPPPTALSTLPTPSKLKDDSFALFNATDFAPPETFRDHVAGRSQSPLGERRPYQQPMVPAASPLVTAFDELAALPSPHLLRKSGTYTNLDFAPPKKFRDNDTMSDAGSIRSNNSGISAMQLSAIRSGAGRVSRLPGDTVFTTHATNGQLKPQWGMRP